MSSPSVLRPRSFSRKCRPPAKRKLSDAQSTPFLPFLLSPNDTYSRSPDTANEWLSSLRWSLTVVAETPSRSDPAKANFPTRSSFSLKRAWFVRGLDPWPTCRAAFMKAPSSILSALRKASPSWKSMPL